MQGKYIQTRIMTGRFTLPVSIIITIICWFVVYVVIPDIQTKEVVHTFWEMLPLHLLPVWANKLISLFFYIITGYLLILMNNSFGLVRIRASVQTSFYLLFVAACPAIQHLNVGHPAALTFVIALYLLFDAYQTIKPSGYLFHAFLFVGLGSIVFPQLILFTPILLIGAFNFQALTLRSFFAAILGFGLPYWFLFGHAFFYDDIDLFYQPFRDLATFYPIDITHFLPWEIATLGFMFVLFLISSIHCIVQGYMDKIRTRVYLRFIILLNFCIFVLIILQPIHCATLLPLLFVGVSILTSHLFVLTKSKLSNVFFISTCIALILLFSYNIWMRL